MAGDQFDYVPLAGDGHIADSKTRAHATAACTQVPSTHSIQAHEEGFQVRVFEKIAYPPEAPRFEQPIHGHIVDRARYNGLTVLISQDDAHDIYYRAQGHTDYNAKTKGGVAHTKVVATEDSPGTDWVAKFYHLPICAHQKYTTQAFLNAIQHDVARGYLKPHYLEEVCGNGTCGQTTQTARWWGVINSAIALNRLGRLKEVGLYCSQRTSSKVIYKAFVVMRREPGHNMYNAWFVPKAQLPHGLSTFYDVLEMNYRMAENVLSWHQKGIVHRDIRPSNFIVQQQAGVWQPTLVDANLSAPTDKDGKVSFSRYAGARGYIASETALWRTRAPVKGMEAGAKTDIVGLTASIAMLWAAFQETFIVRKKSKRILEDIVLGPELVPVVNQKYFAPLFARFPRLKNALWLFLYRGHLASHAKRPNIHIVMKDLKHLMQSVALDIALNHYQAMRKKLESLRSANLLKRAFRSKAQVQANAEIVTDLNGLMMSWAACLGQNGAPIQEISNSTEMLSQEGRALMLSSWTAFEDKHGQQLGSNPYEAVFGAQAAEYDLRSTEGIFRRCDLTPI